jgi:hypothetical protein
MAAVPEAGSGAPARASALAAAPNSANKTHHKNKKRTK